MSLYESPSVQGRRGVVELERAIRIINKKFDEKERFYKFVDKFAS